MERIVRRKGMAIMVAIMAAAMLTGVGTAQEQKKETRQKSSTTQELIDLENEWVAALAKADTAALDGMLADTYVDAEGNQRSDKKGVLAALKSGELKIASIKLSEMHVYDYGDAAVVTGIGEQAGNFKGQALAGKVFFTDTFVRRNGKWRAVASHRTAA